AEQVCNTRVHAETGQTPIQRFISSGPLHAVEPSLLREAFRWSVMRRVTNTASVSLAGNRYTVDQALVGRRVELRFDPEDLTKLPFSKTISAKDLLDRASHQEAVARIRFCIGESLLGVITGEVGVGKTVAVRAAMNQLDQAAHHVVYVANPTVGTRGLYVTIVRALGAVPRGFKAELVTQTQSLLEAEEHERRRRVVLVIDESHLLLPDQLEAIRLLTNANMDSATSCSLLLVGQPTLARQLRMGIFAAL